MNSIDYAIEAVKPPFISPLLGIAFFVLSIIVIDYMYVLEVLVEELFCRWHLVCTVRSVASTLRVIYYYISRKLQT